MHVHAAHVLRVRPSLAIGVAELHGYVAHALRGQPRAGVVLERVKRPGEVAAHRAPRDADALAVKPAALLPAPHEIGPRVALELALERGRRVAWESHAAHLAALLAEGHAPKGGIDVATFEPAYTAAPCSGVRCEEDEITVLLPPAAALVAAGDDRLELLVGRHGPARRRARRELHDAPHVERHEPHEKSLRPRLAQIAHLPGMLDGPRLRLQRRDRRQLAGAVALAERRHHVAVVLERRRRAPAREEIAPALEPVAYRGLSVHRPQPRIASRTPRAAPQCPPLALRPQQPSPLALPVQAR